MLKKISDRLFHKLTPSGGSVAALSLLQSGIGLAIAQAECQGLPRLIHAGFYPCTVDRREQELAAIVGRWGLSSRTCFLVLDPADYRLLQTNMPEVPVEELREALRWRIQDLLDFSAEEAEIEFFAMPASLLPGRNAMASVVACRRTLIQRQLEQCGKFNLKPKVVDICEMALRNVAESLPESGKGLAFLHMGKTRGILQLQKNDTVYVTRMMDFGSQELFQDFLGRDEDDLGGVFGRLALEIQRSMDYYESYFGVSPMSSLVVCPVDGGTDELERRLNQALGLTTRTMDLAEVMSCEEPPDVSTVQLCLPVIGLALRGLAPK